jgi:hypothetical protein
VTNRNTLGELRWPNTPEFTAVAQSWAQDALARMLAFVWAAYDLLLTEVLSQIDCTQADAEVERSITQYLVPRIHRVMNGDEPFFVLHGPYEYETRMPAPAQSPQYDIAFILILNERIMWPLEAKILRTDSAVADYATDIRNEFLTCRYAPFCREGGMLGYLLSGDVSVAFRSITAAVPCTLRSHPAFPSRPHKTSNHRRSVPSGKPYPRTFRCHHLILEISP